MTVLPIILTCASIGGTVVSPPDALENARLRVTFDTSAGVLVVTDRRNGHTWRQANPLETETGDGGQAPGRNARCVQRLVERDPSTGVMRLAATLPALDRKGDWTFVNVPLTVTLCPEEPDVGIAFELQLEGEWSEVHFPFVFLVDGPEGRILMPHCEGMLVPVRENDPAFLDLGRDYIYSGYGAFLACFGTVDMSDGRGVLTYFNTPILAGHQMQRVEASSGPVALPGLFWRSDKYRFDSTRQVTLSFVDTGAHVVLARAYQRLFARDWPVRSLRDKAEDNPATVKLAGAPVFWVFDTPGNTLAVARMMKEDGIDAAIIEIGKAADYWEFHDETEQAERLKSTVAAVRELGYVVSRYDQYRDVFRGVEEDGPWAQINSEGYPDYCVRLEDGSKRAAWPPGFVMNPEMGLRLARQRIPASLAKYPYNGRFIDCIGTCALWESEDWSEGRPLDAHGGLKARMAILDYVASQGLVMGTEGSMDCFMSRLHWIETPMSLVKYTAPDLHAPGWQYVETSETYQVSIGTRYRIPFLSLVHHGSAVFTWRWEDPFQRMPEYWQDKNLWSVLYGNPPLFTLDRENYEHWRGEIAQTWSYVCEWTRRVAYARLMSHRFVTADQKVQETTFDTGDGVVANFGTDTVTLDDGYELPGRTYRTFRTDASPRAYAPPPVAEADYTSRALMPG